MSAAFKMEVVYDEEKRGYASSITIGGEGLVTEVEPHHLEAAIVAQELLRQTIEKMEKHVLRRFIEKAKELRDAKRRALKDESFAEPIKVKDFTVN